MRQKKNEWYRATEKLLFTYKSFPIRIMALLQQIEMVRQQLEPSMIASYVLREGTNYSVSSPVETAALNRIEGDPILKIERKIKNLECLKEIVEVSVDTMLDQEQKLTVEMIYFQKKTWQDTCYDLMIDKNTYYARKDEIVKVLAWCFGYLPDEEVEQVLGMFMDQALWSKNKTGQGVKAC